MYHVFAYYPTAELDDDPCASFTQESDAIAWANDHYISFFDGHPEWKACGFIVACDIREAQEMLEAGY